MEEGNRFADWEIGPERDSFFQIDREYLAPTFDDDVLERIEMVQG